MSDKSAIEWTDATWNPVTGCTKVSSGCKHCYAERNWKRLQHLPRYDRPFTQVECHHDRLEQPLHWKKPRRIFVNSMSDLFHEDVSDDFINLVFAIMALSPQHTFQVLTKRPRRMLDYLSRLDRDEGIGWLAASLVDDYSLSADAYHIASGLIHRAWTVSTVSVPHRRCWPLLNVWLGVSVEDQQTADERIRLLLQTPAAVHWLSIEPMLGPIMLQYDGDYDNPHKLVSRKYLRGIRGDKRINWIVLGGESGPGARPMHPDWVRTIRDQCINAGVPFFFKQWGEWEHIPDVE